MLEVLWEDNHLLVVNKPAGLPVQGDETGDEHLLEIAERYIREKYNKPGAAFVGLIHRIDRPVSGTMMLAKTSKALIRMNEVFRLKQNKKIYTRAIYYFYSTCKLGKLSGLSINKYTS
jgi:23S rRNA pseudouridine1911/1915/1917 synthase